MNIQNITENLNALKKVATNAYNAPLKTSALPLQGFSRLADQTITDQAWLPLLVRSYFRAGRMGMVDTSLWSFIDDIERLDAITPENLREIYSEELRYWQERLQELNDSMLQSILKVYSGILAPISFVSMLCGVGGAYGLVQVFRLHWLLGIPIFFGIATAIALLTWGAMTALSFVRGSRKGKRYADVLLVHSLAKVLLNVFQDDSKGSIGEADRKERIIRGIEESARWLRCLPSQFSSKDRFLKDWYCTQMDRVASRLLALRQGVIMSRPGYIDELRDKLMKYFSATLRKEYGNLLDKEVVPRSRTPLGKARRIAGWTLTLSSLVACGVLLAIDLVMGDKLQLTGAVGGTGVFAVIAVILQALVGTRGLAEQRTGMDVFSHIITNAIEKR